MYGARVVKVMIASPGDVATERAIIRDVIHEWNTIHSEDRAVVLMPVGWETHARPATDERPQASINRQLLTAADLLVAVFWTRLGSPTGVAASGTVEEIEEHVKAGKPAMIYFSATPVRLDSVDDAQYKALLEFRRECQRRWLVQSYDSNQEFRTLFSRQLAQLVIEKFSHGEPDEVPAFAERQERRSHDPVAESLPADARELLLAAAEDKNGVVMRFKTLGGLGIQTNSRQFSEMGDPRSEARWEGALRALESLRLVEAAGYKREVFKLTDLGYQTADRLRMGVGVS